MKLDHLNDRSLGYTLHYTTRMAMAIFQERLRPHRVAVGQFPILVHLWEEEGLTQRDLCDLIRVEQPTLANTLKRMERDGLIKRVSDMNDRRRRRIYLTQRAWDLKETLQAESVAVNSVFIKKMNEAEQSEFKRLMHIIAGTLEEELSKPLYAS